MAEDIKTVLLIGETHPSDIFDITEREVNDARKKQGKEPIEMVDIYAVGGVEFVKIQSPFKERIDAVAQKIIKNEVEAVKEFNAKKLFFEGIDRTNAGVAACKKFKDAILRYKPSKKAKKDGTARQKEFKKNWDKNFRSLRGVLRGIQVEREKVAMKRVRELAKEVQGTSKLAYYILQSEEVFPVWDDMIYKEEVLNCCQVSDIVLVDDYDLGIETDAIRNLLVMKRKYIENIADVQIIGVEKGRNTELFIITKNGVKLDLDIKIKTGEQPTKEMKGRIARYDKKKLDALEEKIWAGVKTERKGELVKKRDEIMIERVFDELEDRSAIIVGKVHARAIKEALKKKGINFYYKEISKKGEFTREEEFCEEML
ncbi:MAG: hypothetical protein ABIF92_00080 [archaeon]